MTAGSVSVPQVIPLRIPLPGKAKRRIDSSTRVEIKSDTPEVSIYYTLDGSKPELYRKPGYGEHNTFKYKSPITLPVGKITVKALAVTKEYQKDNKFFILDLGTEIKTDQKSLQRPRLLSSPLGTAGCGEESSVLPTESLQMAPCLGCGHLVPMNTPACIVCESPIDQQLQPQTNTCFKPDPPPCYFTCFKCGTKTRPYARFCGSCGVYIEPPSRLSSQNGVLMDSGDSLRSSEAKSLQAQTAWQPLPTSLSKSGAELKETEDKGTQTVGLFYPSSKLLEKKELELVLHKEKLQKMSDHKPLLTAISPGKG
ncbi:hypothetical protein CIB84_005691 [Bambusicola thoracicus]|uniref:DZANK-type domain-containing protein n=1 Tax=Bambusicola thoracicus TaxID=9083 RepID=A0A2P4T2G6_BAMTH|nr:hypothetical protein CIB84_005691 [Bambusicola thoracicus]